MYLREYCLFVLMSIFGLYSHCKRHSQAWLDMLLRGILTNKVKWVVYLTLCLLSRLPSSLPTPPSPAPSFLTIISHHNHTALYRAASDFSLPKTEQEVLAWDEFPLRSRSSPMDQYTTWTNHLGQREDFEGRVWVTRRFRAKFKVMRMSKKPVASLKL